MLLVPQMKTRLALRNVPPAVPAMKITVCRDDHRDGPVSRVVAKSDEDLSGFSLEEITRAVARLRPEIVEFVHDYRNEPYREGTGRVVWTSEG